jgi:DNA-binding Lrp family transcriptional regulator
MRPCTVCRHPERPAIENALLKRESSSRIAERVGLSNWSILRHRKHLERGVVVERVDPNLSLVERIELCSRRVDAIASAATMAKSWSAATQALRELRCCLELLARMSGVLKPAGINVAVGVGVNVNSHTQQLPAGKMTDLDLDYQLAMDVAEATHGFDEIEIARLRALAQQGVSRDLPERRL